METLRPLGTEVLVHLDSKIKTAGGGLLIRPDVMVDQPTTGTVIAIGSEQRDLRVGERVFFGKWNGREVDARASHKLGYDPGSLYVMQPVSTGASAQVHEDHICLVLEPGDDYETIELLPLRMR